MIAWIKSRPWWQYLAGLAAALAFGFASGAVRRRKAHIKAMERKAEELAAGGARRGVERAAALTEKAETHRQKAEAAATAAEARLDEIGASDETLADLVDNWNADRVRDRSG